MAQADGWSCRISGQTGYMSTTCSPTQASHALLLPIPLLLIMFNMTLQKHITLFNLDHVTSFQRPPHPTTHLSLPPFLLPPPLRNQACYGRPRSPGSRQPPHRAHGRSAFTPTAAGQPAAAASRRHGLHSSFSLPFFSNSDHQSSLEESFPPHLTQTPRYLTTVRPPSHPCHNRSFFSRSRPLASFITSESTDTAPRAPFAREEDGRQEEGRIKRQRREKI